MEIQQIETQRHVSCFRREPIYFHIGTDRKIGSDAIVLKNGYKRIIEDSASLVWLVCNYSSSLSRLLIPERLGRVVCGGPKDGCACC